MAVRIVRQLSLVFKIILILLPIAQHAAAQVSWRSLPVGFNGELRSFYVDSTDTTIFLGGNFDQINGLHTGCLVKLRKDYSLVPLSSVTGAGLLTIIKWRGELYIGGYIGLCKYNGNTWEILDSNELTLCFYPYKNNLLIGGNFSGGFAGNPTLTGPIIEYDGVTFRNFKGVDSVITPDCFVGKMLEYNGDLIVAGNIDPKPPINWRFKEIVRWTGLNWEPLADGMFGGGSDEVNNLLVLNGELYVAGTFKKSEGAPGNNIAKWNGFSWDDMGGGVEGVVYDLSNRGDTVLVTGAFNNAGGKSCQHFAAYSRGKWCVNTISIDNPITFCADFFGDLIVGGGFWKIGTDSCLSIAQVTSLGNCLLTTKIDNTPFNYIGELLLQPNPSKGSITVRLTTRRPLKHITVLVWSASGAQVWNRTYACEGNEFTAEVNMANAPGGIYFVDVIANGEKYIKKFQLD